MVTDSRGTMGNRLISSVQCLQDLVATEPFVFWDKEPTKNTEDCDRAEDDTSLEDDETTSI